MNFLYMWILVSAFLLEVQQTMAKRDKSLHCSICRAMVVEIDAQIGDVDPTKKIETGSYRVDPDGNQKLVKKQYARSDVHLTEIFEKLCNTFDDYALTQNPTDKKLGVTRVKDRKTGEELDTKNVGFNENLRNTFKGYCHSVIEEHEDDMLRLFKEENLKSVEAELCGGIVEACSEKDLKRPITKLEKKQERHSNSFHQLEPEKEDEEEIQADEDLEENIVQKSDKKKKSKKAEEEL